MIQPDGPPLPPPKPELDYENVTDGLSEQMQTSLENSPLKLDEVFKTVIEGNASFLDTFRMIVSSLCILFIIIHLIKTIYDASSDPKKAETLTPLYIVKMIGLVLCVCFYNRFFTVAEGWLVALSDSKIMNHQISWDIALDLLQSVFSMMVRDYLSLMAENSTNFSVFGFNLSALGQSVAVAMAPNKWVYAFTALGSIAAYFNYLVSFVAYLDRTIILMLLNVLAPFAFSLTILEDYRKLASKYFMMIVCVMLVYPFILISFEVVDQVYLRLCTVFGILHSSGVTDNIPRIFQEGAGGVAMGIGAIAGMMNYDIFLKFPLLTGCIFLKLKFLSLIGQTLWKIFL